MIHHLKQHWEKLAAYLGYTELEIDFIARTGGSNVYHEIQMFMRTWWMPDCGKERTQAILSQGVCSILRVFPVSLSPCLLIILTLVCFPIYPLIMYILCLPSLTLSFAL